MKKIFTFVFAAVTLLFQSAAFAQQTQNGPQTAAQISEMLPGSWEWTESRFASRGVQPTVKTPATENRNITITFRPDNLASVYENKKFAGMYQYNITQQPNDYAIIRFKTNEGQTLPDFLPTGPISINDNEIYIAGGYNDAGMNVKFRKAGTKPTPAPQAAEPAQNAQPATPAPKAAPATKPATSTKTQTKVKSESKPGSIKVKTETKSGK